MNPINPTHHRGQDALTRIASARADQPSRQGRARRPLARSFVALAAAAMAWTVTPASAATNAMPPTATATAAVVNQGLGIQGFDVEAVDRLEPGADLSFTVWGTPGAQARVRIPGAQRDLTLTESRPGLYEGVYTLSRRDRVDPAAQVSVTLTQARRSVTARLDQPLLSPALQTPTAAVPAALHIERFEWQGPRRPGPGDTVRFTVLGSPGARAVVRLPGSPPERLALTEVQPGRYEATHVLRSQQSLEQGQATATLRSGRDTARTTLATAGAAAIPPVSGAARPARAAVDNRSEAQRPWMSCLDCGRVTAIEAVEVDGEGSLVGPALGGVIGGVLGNQVGKGDGRTAASVVGAIGGALIGREVERRQGRSVRQQVTVQLDQGEQRQVLMDDASAFQIGERVQFFGDELREVTDRR